VNEDTKVRRAIVEAHGLPWTAARFLDGSTVAELESSATRLAELMGKERAPERELTFFEAAAIAKHERKRELEMILTGRAQPRDQAGRYTKPATFDGGARAPAPFKGPPEHEHNRTLLDAMRSGESDVGASF
jgi:hypothetical protein